MKKIAKSAALLGILISLAVSCFTGANATYITDLGGRVYINNTYGTSSYQIDNTAYPASADMTVSDYQSLVKAVEHEYVLRAPSFTVRYNTTYSQANSIKNTLFQDVFAYDDPTTTSDLDYLEFNMNRYGFSGSFYSMAAESYAIYTFTQTYRTTADQENFVNTTVKTALQALNVGSSSAYTKIKAVQDYILENVSYDYSLSKFTAYDALASGQTVCQGYALLTYKMLTDLGVPVRIITGTAAQSAESHAWNIVKIGQYWYNLDTTWDDQTVPTRYFLRDDAAFSDHIRDGDYTSQAFNASYPMSPTDYNPALQVQAIAFQQNEGVYAVGDTFALKAAVTPATAATAALSWTSSDPAVATVDSTGKVTVIGAGKAVITAASTDGSGATAAFSLTADKADVPSAWAKTGVGALNARGVIPASLSSGYQSPITRAEFTALIMNVYEYAKGPYSLKKTPPFSDIAGSSYIPQISKGFELGIISGTGATTFVPDGTLTREQCAKIAGAAVGAVSGTPVTSTAALPFTDSGTIDGWAVDFVRYAYEKGLMAGTGAAFEPFGILTREQAMLIAERMIEKYGW